MTSSSRSIRSAVLCATVLVGSLGLVTCGDDDGPAPTQDSGSETDTSIRLDSSTNEDTSVPETDTGAPPADTGSPGEDSSTPTADAGSCAAESTSCANGETCCTGLMCCTGVPVPAGSEYCGMTCPRSDRDSKQDFETIDVDDVLDGVRSMEITRWSYRDAPDVRHVGPMAQDFHAAFDVGETPRNIAPIDAQGVALAAIQALARRQEALTSENADLRRRIAELERAASHARRSARSTASRAPRAPDGAEVR